MQVERSDLGLSKIPKYYGLRQVELKYKLITFEDNLIVISTESAVIICYDYNDNVISRIPPQGYKEITCLVLKRKVIVWGTSNGYIGVRDTGSDHVIAHVTNHVMPVSLPNILQAQCNNVTVLGKVHESSVQCVTYRNSLIYSGDEQCVLIQSEINWNKGTMSSSTIHTENSEIYYVASVTSDLLLVSSMARTFLLNVGISGYTITPIGTKDRKRGMFGCCVLDEYTVLVGRPGFRLWYTHAQGNVLKTIQLKAMLAECQMTSLSSEEDVPLSSLLPKSGIISTVRRVDDKVIVVQFGDVFVMVETIDLTVLGWFRETVIDWCVSHQQLLFLYSTNEIRRYVIKMPSSVEEEGDCSSSTDPTTTPASDQMTSSDQDQSNPPIPTPGPDGVAIDDVKPEDSDIPHISETFCNYVALNEITLETPNFISSDGVSVRDDTFQEWTRTLSPDFSVSAEKLAEISDFVNSVRDRKVSEELDDQIPEICEVPDSSKSKISPNQSESETLQVQSESETLHIETETNVCLEDELSQTLPYSSSGDNLSNFDGRSETSGSWLSDSTEMCISQRTKTLSSDKSVVEELKENISKSISALGLSPSPNKPRQLIRSEINIPGYEPDKISLSSQDTVSLNSSSSNTYDEEDDKIATRIRKPNNRTRPKAIEECKENIPQNILIVEIDDYSKDTDIHDADDKEHGSDERSDDGSPREESDSLLHPTLDIGTILTDLENLDQTTFNLAVLGVPELGNTFEEYVEEEETTEQPHNIPLPDYDDDTEDDLPGDDQASEFTTSTETLHQAITMEDVYSVRSYSESTDVYMDELERRASVEYGEDPLTCDSDEDDVQPQETRDDNGVTRADNVIPRADNVITRAANVVTRADNVITRAANVVTRDDNVITRAANVVTRDDNVITRDHNVVTRGARANREISSGSYSSYCSSRSSVDKGKPASVSRDSHVSPRENTVATRHNYVIDDNWVELRGPTVSKMYVTISTIAVSNFSVWCLDNWGNVYFSENKRGSSLTWEKVPCKLMSLECSDSGYVVWGVTNTRRAVVRVGITPSKPRGVDWSELMLDAVSVTVDDTCVWLMVAEQKLYCREGVTPDEPQGERWQPVSLQNLNITSISVSKGVVWGVLDSAKLVVRHGITEKNPLGNSWHVMPVSCVKECHVGRALECGWVVDTAGIVHFQCGVTPAKPRGSNLWWQVSVSEHLGSSQIPNVGLFSLAVLRRKSLQVKKVCSSSEGGVWLLSNYATLHRRYGNISGHNWANVSRTYITGYDKWRYLAAKGADDDVVGPVWGLTVTGDIICFTRSAPPQCISSPSQFSVVSIAASVDVLWAVDHSGQVYIREDINSEHLVGSGWDKLDMTQLRNVNIKHLSCSDKCVWAVDNKGIVWYRSGVTARTTHHIVQAWLKVDSHIAFKQVAVGYGGWMVWGIDLKNNVYVRTNVTSLMSVGDSWELIPGTQCTQLCISATQVFGVSPANQIVCRYGITKAVPAGNYWRRLPGPPPDGRVRLVSTTFKNSLWCEVRTGTIYRRRIKTMFDKSQLESAALSSGVDEEWEVL